MQANYETLVSSYVAVGETDTVKRFDASSKIVVTVQRPEIVLRVQQIHGRSRSLQHAARIVQDQYAAEKIVLSVCFLLH